MNIFYLILIAGLVMGVFAVIIAMIVERVATRRKNIQGTHNIPKSQAIVPRLNPGALIARWGSNAPTHHSLDTVVMRPTIGVKAFVIGMVLLMLFIMSGEAGAVFRNDIITVTFVVATVVCVLLFLSLYEVRYDSESITVPDVFFQSKTYRWDSFIAINQSDDVTYTLFFEDGKVRVRKFLVGMPTFLTFVTEVRDMNSRALY